MEINKLVRLFQRRPSIQFSFLLAFKKNNNKAYVKEQAKYHVITIWNKKVFSFIISINVRIMSMLYCALGLKTSL